MFANLLFAISLVVALGIGLVYFRDIGDVSQMVLKVKRENMLRFIRYEYRILTVGLVATAVLIVAYFDMDGGPAWVFWPAIVLIAFLYIFTWVWIHIGLRNQAGKARFYNLDEARKILAPGAGVIVIENNGVARAPPDSHLMRPHLVGDGEGLGGANVIMLDEPTI